jgi:hypothetical protein
MSDTKSSTSIRVIVSKARARARIPEDRDPMCFQAVIDGMKRLSLFNLPQCNVLKVIPDSLGRVKFPSDCLKFLSLSVPNGGKDYTFTRDRAIVSSSDKTYVYEAFDTKYGENQKMSDVFSYGMGKGGSSEVVFNVNERLGYAQVVGFLGTQCTLNYISSGITENPEGVEIPKIAEEALIAFVLWRESEYDLTMSIGERQFREQKFFNEADDLDMINYTPTKDEIMDSYYSNLYQTIKR